MINGPAKWNTHLAKIWLFTPLTSNSRTCFWPYVEQSLQQKSFFVTSCSVGSGMGTRYIDGFSIGRTRSNGNKLSGTFSWRPYLKRVCGQYGPQSLLGTYTVRTCSRTAEYGCRLSMYIGQWLQVHIGFACFASELGSFFLTQRVSLDPSNSQVKAWLLWDPSRVQNLP